MLPVFCGRQDECLAVHTCHERQECLHPDRSTIHSPDQLELDGYWVTPKPRDYMQHAGEDDVT